MRNPEHDWSLPHVGAHKHSSHHRAELERSDTCGCFYCLAIFPTAQISEWTDEVSGAGTTAICPRCGIDSVIGAASGFPIQLDFLSRMKVYWFET
jgi:hypothetical protein